MAVAEFLGAPPHVESDLAVMMTGGGARAAYQVGLLRGIARHFPHIRFQIITGVSAGAINAVFLAASDLELAATVDRLANMWCELECSHVFQMRYLELLAEPMQSFVSIFRSHRKRRASHGFLDIEPLAQLLRRVYHTRPGRAIDGIARNLQRGVLNSVAIMALDYSTGQSVRFVQGRNVDNFDRPNRRSTRTELTVEHVLASASLPFVFPAIRIGSRWYGDGGIRLAAPLSPAIHLGARRILAMSTGYQRSQAEASQPVVQGYPPAAQILGQMVNAVFLDVIDEDVLRLARMNEWISAMAPGDRNGFRPIDLCVLRPSVDLGKLAGDYEQYLPRNVKMLTRLLGTRDTEVPDFLSLLMFEPHYTRRLIEIGEGDVERRLGELRTFLGDASQERVVAAPA